LAWGVFEVAVHVIASVYHISILNTQLGLKSFAKKGHIFLCVAFLAIAILIHNSLNQNDTSSALLAAVLLIIYAALFTKGRWLFKIFWIIFPIALLICAELLALSALTYLRPEPLALYFTLPGLYRTQFVAISSIIKIGLIIFFLRLKVDMEKLGHSFLVTLLIPVMASALVIVYQVVELYTGRITNALVTLLTAAMLLGFNLFALWAIMTVDKKNKIISEYELQVLKAKHQKQLSATLAKIEILEADNYKIEQSMAMNQKSIENIEAMLKKYQASIAKQNNPDNPD